MGVSGRAMLRALVEGTTDPVVLADLARGKLRQRIPDLQRALQGRFRAHHAFLLQQILTKIDFLDETVARVTGKSIGDWRRSPSALSVGMSGNSRPWGFTSPLRRRHS
jgi:hypothetical protein